MYCKHIQITFEILNFLILVESLVFGYQNYSSNMFAYYLFYLLAKIQYIDVTSGWLKGVIWDIAINLTGFGDMME